MENGLTLQEKIEKLRMQKAGVPAEVIAEAEAITLERHREQELEKAKCLQS